jgi:hypothetical protein
MVAARRGSQIRITEGSSAQREILRERADEPGGHVPCGRLRPHAVSGDVRQRST